jgi:hypothetical protein
VLSGRNLGELHALRPPFPGSKPMICRHVELGKKADDGTRTHGLLHGKGWRAFAPVRSGSLNLSFAAASGRASERQRSRAQPLQPLRSLPRSTRSARVAASRTTPLGRASDERELRTHQSRACVPNCSRRLLHQATAPRSLATVELKSLDNPRPRSPTERSCSEVRYPEAHLIFANSGRFAEEWTYPLLTTALAIRRPQQRLRRAPPRGRPRAAEPARGGVATRSNSRSNCSRNGGFQHGRRSSEARNAGLAHLSCRLGVAVSASSAIYLAMPTVIAGRRPSPAASPAADRSARAGRWSAGQKRRES